MAEGIPTAFAVDLTRKWRALAERRKAHLVDLYDSGRWRLYYSEHDFVLRLREAIGAVEKWSATERSAMLEAAALSLGPILAVNGEADGEADGEPGVRLELVNGAHCAGVNGEPMAMPAAATSTTSDAGGEDIPAVETAVRDKVA